MAQNPQDAAMIDQIAAQAMGVAPQQPQEPAADAKKEDSNEGKAAEQGSPETEGDKIAAEAMYEIDFGEGTIANSRNKSNTGRYSALNYKNAQYKPVMDVIEQYMRSNPGMASKQLAETLGNLAKADQSNPTMGNTEGDKSGQYNKDAALNANEMEASLSKWEEENAATLPPGYKEMMLATSQGNQGMQNQVARLEQMLKMVLAQSQGNVDAARQGMEGAQKQQINAVRQQIANNIDRVQAALGLPDDKADDFMMFAAERGFTMEDFVDPQMTIRVMQDFKYNMDSPEMERMRAIAQRLKPSLALLAPATAAPSYGTQTALVRRRL